MNKIDSVPEAYLISVASPYGPLLTGRNYLVVESGRDWLKVKNDGKAIFLPKNLAKQPVIEKVEEQDEEFEEYSEYANY